MGYSLLTLRPVARLADFCTRMLERQHGAAALDTDAYTQLGAGVFDALAEEDWGVFMPLYRHPVIHELARSVLGRGFQLGGSVSRRRRSHAHARLHDCSLHRILAEINIQDGGAYEYTI